MIWINAGATFGIAALLTAIATSLAIRVAVSFGLVSYPNRIVPQHTRPVAHSGGLALALGATTTWVSLKLGPVPLQQQLKPSQALLVGSILFLLIGFCDDLLKLAPLSKFALQFAGAIISVFLGVAAPLGNKTIPGWAFSCFWILATVNATNLTDVCDGLLASLSLLAFLFFAALNFAQSGLAVLLAGACFGFLIFNRPPARIFLGDTGSHLLGFLLAFFTLSEVARRPHFSTWVAMVLVLAVPLFETTFLIFVRTRKRLPFWRGSPDHFSLRMQAAGLSRIQTDSIAMAIMALLCVIAWLVLRNPPWPQEILLSVTGLLVLGVWWRLLLRYEARTGGAV